MTLKPFLGKYKVKDVTEYLQEQEKRHLDEIAALNAQIEQLKEENARLAEENAVHKKNESVISQVMFDATKKAKEIEDDYRKRADESDAACQKLHDEWVRGMQSAVINLQKLRQEAKSVLENIDSQFASLSTWADNRLESLKAAQLPTSSGDTTLEAEIINGAGADLKDVLKEMGIGDEEKDDNDEE